MCAVSFTMLFLVFVCCISGPIRDAAVTKMYIDFLRNDEQNVPFASNTALAQTK